MYPIKCIVAGSREITDYEMVNTCLREVFKDMYRDEIEIVSGTCRGPDRLGERFARNNGLGLMRFPADWDTHGRSAGYIRNDEMRKYANMSVIFWDQQSRGTRHMINLSIKHGLPTWIFDQYGNEIGKHNVS